MRRIFLALALCAVALPCAAGSQFIDRSVVTFPNKTDHYQLTETLYEAKEFNNGIASTYTVEGASPNLRLNLYVYPLGRGEEAQVVPSQAAEVEHGVQEATRLGLYGSNVVGARSPFVVVLPDSLVVQRKTARHEPFDPTPQKEFGLSANKDADPVTKAVAESFRAPVSHGVRQAFSVEREGVKYRSYSYVFYRHLMGFKLRISVPEDDMSQADFEKAADNAARWLVPQVDVQNFGECGVIEVGDLGEGKDTNQQGAATLLREMARVQWESCASNDGGKWTKPALAGKSVEIVYPAGTWVPKPN